MVSRATAVSTGKTATMVSNEVTHNELLVDSAVESEKDTGKIGIRANSHSVQNVKMTTAIQALLAS